MATYIKPTITLTANKQSATSNPGPLSVALALSTTDLLTVDNVQSQIYDVDTGANVEIANGSELSSAFVPGTNGAFVYLKNVTASGTVQAENLTATDDLTVNDQVSIDGTLNLATGSITDSDGSISFGNKVKAND